MTNELAKRYAQSQAARWQSREEQITDEELKARVEAALAQARASHLQAATGAVSGATGAASCVAMVVAGLFALAAIFG